MRTVATYGIPTPPVRGRPTEYRMDVFSELPDNLGNDDIITLCGVSSKVIPNGFEGLVDNGNHPLNGFRNVFSIHDYQKTPSCDDIVDMLSNKEQEIVKGAFFIHCFDDLHQLYLASKKIHKKHVIIGMGELGKITRIRSPSMGNEFAYGYVGKPTAEGQFPLEKMESIDDDHEVIGIVGNPLSKTMSPLLHEASMNAFGIAGTYLKFETQSIHGIADVMKDYNIKGLNITLPFKQSVMKESIPMDSSISVGNGNTLVLRNGEVECHNTDAFGVEYAFDCSNTSMKGSVLIIGTGGSARTCAYVASSKGCDVFIIGRNNNERKKICDFFGLKEFNGKDVSSFDVVINCTPLGMYSNDPYPIDTNTLSKDTIVFDLVYTETPLKSIARDKGCTLVDGKDMLIGQAAESFRLWFGKYPIDVMRKVTL